MTTLSEPGRPQPPSVPGEGTQLRDGLNQLNSQEKELVAKIKIKDVEAKLERVQTLFRHIQVPEEQEKVNQWRAKLKEQVDQLLGKLTSPTPNGIGEQAIDDCIDIITNGIRELEDYLVSRIGRSFGDWLRRKPDPRKPFLEDGQRLITELFETVGKLGVRLEEVPEDKEKQWLKAQLEDVENTLESVTVTADPSDISWARRRLAAIGHRLPPSNQFWIMLAPILGVASLQLLIWWLAFRKAADAEVIVGVTSQLFFGVVVAGTLGSLVRVIFRAIGLEYRQYRSYLSLYLVGLVRPILGAVLALAVLLLFNSTWVNVPLSSPNASPVLPVPPSVANAGISFSAKEVFFLLAGFLAGFSDEWVLGLIGRKQPTEPGKDSGNKP